MHRAALVLLLLAVAAFAADEAGAAESAPAADDPNAGTWLDSLTNAFTDWLPDMSAPDPNTGNRAAFLAMIRQSEGTSGPNGYRTYYGGSLFDSFADHPNVKHTAAGITSTAAGAYQFLYRTWIECKAALGLPDFSPESQDAAAIFLLKRRGALPYIDRGDFAGAVNAARREWASLPGAGYGQHENSLAVLEAAYLAAGGSVA